MPAPTIANPKTNRAVTPASAPEAPKAQPAAVPIATATAKSGKTATPGHEEIAKRAYELYLARGKSGGKEMEDWIQAERELSARANGRN